MSYLQKEFNKSYEENHKAERKSILIKKIKYTFKHNMEARMGEHDYLLGINQFSDLVHINFDGLY